MTPLVSQLWPQFMADPDFAASFGRVIVEHARMLRQERQVVFTLRSAAPLDKGLCARLLASLQPDYEGFELKIDNLFGYATLDEAAVERDDLPVFRQTAAWLDAYFVKRPLPDLPPLAPRGSDFRQAVWRLLLEIPYGQVTTYGALAQILRDRGISAAAQAVGGAVGHNKIAIIIPCHRVVGAHGSLTGFSAGIQTKIKLLQAEGVDTSKFFIPQKGTAL